MNIRFDRIEIENFRSIERASIELSNQGTVIVKGVNEYEDKATSNGSGKSSVFEAIIYSIFEETSAGEKDVANRIINDGFNVTLYFSIDTDKYIITRYSKGGKANVVFYKNNIDISARNKTDTNKLIITTLGITKDIFLDSVFLSQNANTNLASLSPTSRKERLEVLTNTEYTITQFKDRLKMEQNKYEANCVKAKLDLTKLEGNIDAIERQKKDIQYKIDEIDRQIAKRDAMGNVNDIENEIAVIQESINVQSKNLDAIEKEIEIQEQKIVNFRNTGEDNQEARDKLNSTIVNKREACNILQHNIDTLNLQNKQSDSEIQRLNREIAKIKNSDICPTCGRKYDNINEEHITNTIKELEDTIRLEDNKKVERNKEIVEKQETLSAKINEGKSVRAELDNLDIEINKFKKELNNMEMVKSNLIVDRQKMTNNIKSLQLDIDSLRSKKDQILKIEVGNKEEFVKMLNDLDNEIKAIEVNKKSIEDIYKQNNEYEEVIKNSIQLVTKEFRTYLLQASIQYLNKLLCTYSSELFSNAKDIISINSDDAKLDIKLGDATYESLSGGEKTRVNIALLLAQKSLASIIGNIHCNMIILDEILGYCDNQAENNVIDLIVKELEDLESIYMVSHKEIPIGYDTQLIIVKGKDGLSRIREY